MTRAPVVRLLFCATLIGSVFELGLPGRAEDLVLLRLDRRQPVLVPADITAAIVPLQELRTAWIVSAPSSVVTRLRRARAVFEVLDTAPAGRTLQLVLGGRPDQLGQVRRVGKVWTIEEGVWLVASGAELDLEQLPPNVSLKRVAGRLPVPLVLEQSGSVTAVLRARQAAPPAVDARIQALVAQVSRERLSDGIKDLESYGTRYATTGNCYAAGVSIYESFRSLGVQAETDEFVLSAAPMANVIATIPGRTSPEEVVIVGAHYDSYARVVFATAAPGADDNASGTAAIMEIARVLASQPLDFTVRFVAFSAEETGLNGSRRYAGLARQRGDRIVAMLNLDMIAYVDRAPEDLDVVANPASEWLAAHVVSTAATYTGLPIAKSVNASFKSSDHASFWDQGYAAVCQIEDTGVPNPYYHTTGDRFETLDMGFATSVVQTTLAAAVSLAQPVSTPGPPMRVKVRTQLSSSLFSNLSSAIVEWDRSRDAVVGYNVYRASTAHGDYQRLNGVPLPGTSFVGQRFFRSVSPPGPAYYVVTAVDASGRESNRSMEVREQ